MTIQWLSININPPKLDTEIIVKNSKTEKIYAGIYCEIRFYSSSVHDEQEMLDDLMLCGFDRWSDTE